MVKILSTNVAMMSLRPLGVDGGSRLFLPSDVWRTILARECDIICLNELRPGCNARLWQEQLIENHNVDLDIHIPSRSSYVAICTKRHLHLSLRQDVVQHDRAATWWIHLPRPVTDAFEDSDRFCITIVYAPVDAAERRIFFEEDLSPILQGLIFDTDSTQGQTKVACLITGDFNDYPTSLDVDQRSQGEEARRHWIRSLEPCLMDTNIVDIYRQRNPDAETFSFTFKRGNEIISRRRLDHALVNEAMGQLMTDINYTTAPLGRMLDHNAIIIDAGRIEKGIKQHGMWRLHSSLLLSKDYVAELERVIVRYDKANARKDPVNYLQGLLNGVKDFSLQYLTRTKEGYRQRDLAANTRSLAEQLVASIDGQTSVITGSLVSEYVESYKLDVARIEQSRRFRLQQEERTPTGFSRDVIMRTSGLPTRINALKDPTGVDPPTIDQAEIRERVAKYYEGLYKPEHVEHEHGQEASILHFLQHGTSNGMRPKITSSDYKRLQKALTDKDLNKAGGAANSTSAAGVSGLPYTFWITYKERFSPWIARLANDMMLSRPLSKDEPTIPVTILYKKGPKDEIQNYRPIALIDTHLRLIMIAICQKLGPALSRVIPSTQTAFIPGRFIIMNVLTIFMIIEARNMDMIADVEATLLSLDQEKAYDRVSRDWLWSVLRFYGIPDRITTMLKTYYQNASAKYKVNGVFTRLIKLQCGLLQGDPVSTLLYVLTIQPFLSYLENADIGITVASRLGEIKLSHVAFADDVWVFIRNSQAYEIFRSIGQQFSRVSNSKFNTSKSRLFALFETNSWTQYMNESYQDLPEEFVCLGIPMRRDGNIPAQALLTALAKVSGMASSGGFDDFSMLGRVNIVNTFLTSKLWYCLQIGPVGNEIMRNMRQFMTNYIFHSKKAFVNFKSMTYPRHMGGMNLLDPEDMTTAMQGNWLARTMSTETIAGNLFRLVYAEVMYNRCHRDPIYCIVGPRIGKGNRVSPFFVRVIRTLRRLGTTLGLDLETYSTDQALSLPWKDDILYRSIAKVGIRSARGGLERDTGINWNAEYAPKFTGRTFRDILFWNEDEFHMMVPNVSMAEALIAHPRFARHRDRLEDERELKKAWRFIARHIEPHIMERLPQHFREKLLPSAKPGCCNSVRTIGGRTVFDFADYRGFDALSMLPWHDVSMAGRAVGKYEVKHSRKYLKTKNKSPNFVLVPTHAQTIKFPTKEDEYRVWKKQWEELHVSYRTPEHISIYFQLMHGRCQLARDYSVRSQVWEDFVAGVIEPEANAGEEEDSGDEEDEDYDPDDENPENDVCRVSYRTAPCPLCYRHKDSVHHGYVLCQEVQAFWKRSFGILLQALGHTGNGRLEDAVQAIQRITWRDAVFCFPVLKGLTKQSSPERARLIVWHSCCIVTLFKMRRTALQAAYRNQTLPVFDTTDLHKECDKEYRLMLVDIYRERRRLDDTDGRRMSKRVDTFFTLFINRSKMARRTAKGFTFVYTG